MEISNVASTLTAPITTTNSDNDLVEGGTVNVTWDASGVNGTVRIDFSSDDGSTWLWTAGWANASTGWFSFVLPNPLPASWGLAYHAGSYKSFMLSVTATADPRVTEYETVYIYNEFEVYYPDAVSGIFVARCVDII
jgi:hypothetical protein